MYDHTQEWRGSLDKERRSLHAHYVPSESSAAKCLGLLNELIIYLKLESHSLCRNRTKVIISMSQIVITRKDRK